MLTDNFVLNMAAYSNVSSGESSSLVNYFPGLHRNMLVLVSWYGMWTHAKGLLKHNYAFSSVHICSLPLVLCVIGIPTRM